MLNSLTRHARLALEPAVVAVVRCTHVAFFFSILFGSLSPANNNGMMMTTHRRAEENKKNAFMIVDGILERAAGKNYTNLFYQTPFAYLCVVVIGVCCCRCLVRRTAAACAVSAHHDRMPDQAK